MNPRTLTAIAAVAKPLPNQGILQLPRTEISRIRAFELHERGLEYTTEIAAEFDWLAGQSAEEALRFLDQGLEDSHPENFRFRQTFSTYSPPLRRYTAAHSARTLTGQPHPHSATIQPDYRYTHVSQPESTNGATKLVIGNWHNQAAIYQSATSDGLVTSAAMMLLDEEELVRLLPFVDTSEDFFTNLTRIYESQFTKDLNVTPNTRWRSAFLATRQGQVFKIDGEVQTDANADYIHYAEPFHETAQGAVFLRDMSAYFPDYPKHVILVGFVNFGTGAMPLSLPMQLAMQYALNSSRILESTGDHSRLAAYIELDDNLGTLLEATKRDDLMSAHGALWSNQLRQKHGMSVPETVIHTPKD